MKKIAKAKEIINPEKDVKREPGQISFKDAMKKATDWNPRKTQSK